jgi:hypothetical protein
MQVLEYRPGQDRLAAASCGHGSQEFLAVRAHVDAAARARAYCAGHQLLVTDLAQAHYGQARVVAEQEVSHAAGRAASPGRRIVGGQAEVGQYHIGPQVPTGFQRLFRRRDLADHLDPRLVAGKQPCGSGPQQGPGRRDQDAQPRAGLLIVPPVREAGADPRAPAGQRVDVDRRAKYTCTLADVAQPEAIALPLGPGIEALAVVLNQQGHGRLLVHQAKPDRTRLSVPDDVGERLARDPQHLLRQALRHRWRRPG